MRILSFFKTSFLHATLRFNLAVICCAVLTYCLIFRPPLFTELPSYIGILSCGISWFVASKLFTEGSNLPKWSYYLLSLPVFIGFSYYFYLYPTAFWLMGTLFLCFISLIFIAPFLGTLSDSDDLWTFHFEILKNIIYTSLASLILLTGTNLVLLSLEYLFGFIPYNGVYMDAFIIITAFIFPVIKLSGIPRNFEDHTYSTSGSILLKLILYICIPLLLVYGVILHAYSFKIMISQELPKGKVAYLVAVFETLMLITYILIQRWKNENSFIRLFHRYIGWFMLTPLILMAWGLWERLSIFGLTEPRYFVTLLWIWFAICTTITLIRTLNPALWIIGIFSGLFLISSLGPWSIQELPIHQQLNTLNKTLTKIRSTATKTATHEEQIIVSSILDYLNSRNRLKDVHDLYLTPSSERSSESVSPRSVSLGLGVQYVPYLNRTQNKNSHSVVHYKTLISALPVNEYSHMISGIRLSTDGALSHSFDIKGLGSFIAGYNPSINSFEIRQKDSPNPIYKVHLPDLIHKLAAGSEDTLQINPKLTTQTKNRITIQVIFTEVKGTTNTPNSLSIDTIHDINLIILIQNNRKK